MATLLRYPSARTRPNSAGSIERPSVTSSARSPAGAISHILWTLAWPDSSLARTAQARSAPGQRRDLRKLTAVHPSIDPVDGE